MTLGWTITVAVVVFILILIWIFWPRDGGIY